MFALWSLSGQKTDIERLDPEFTFRYFAPYVFTEETAMMGGTKLVRILPVRYDGSGTTNLARGAHTLQEKQSSLVICANCR
jgi:hypothetical protein